MVLDVLHDAAWHATDQVRLARPVQLDRVEVVGLRARSNSLSQVAHQNVTGLVQKQFRIIYPGAIEVLGDEQTPTVRALATDAVFERVTGEWRGKGVELFRVLDVSRVQ